MVGLIISIVVLAALAGLFVWAAIRAWRSGNAWVRWVGGILASLLALVFTAVTVVSLVGVYKMNVAPYQYPENTALVPVTGDADQVARGKEWAVACAGCHSSTGELPLDGSKDNFLEGGPPMGVLYAPNLTPSGPLKDWTDAQIVRAIREGVDKDGRPLLIMPSSGFHGMSDADVLAIVAFLRSQPPSQRNVPPKDMSVLAAAFLGAGMFPTSAQPPITGPVVAPPRGPTAEYGHYLTTATGCRDCHGANLAGGTPGGGPPPGPNLGAVIPSWKEADFITMFRTGVAPGNVQINPDMMPWKEYTKIFTDDDLRALYQYLHSLPPTGEPAQ